MMKKICILILFIINLLPTMENGKFTVTTHQAKAQTYGAEYTCEDNDGKPISQSIPCDEGPCVHGCPTCHGSYPCDSPHQCPAISHNGEGLPDNGSGSGNGSSGSGSSGGGNGGTSGGSSGSSSGGSGSSGGGGGSSVVAANGPHSATALKNAAKAGVAAAIRERGMTNAACNVGVREAHKYLYPLCKELENKRANDMVKYWRNSPNWVKIPTSVAQSYANLGYFVVGGWYNNIPGKSGHVVVVVPGQEERGYPIVMDTGINMRNEKQRFTQSFRTNKRPNVEFYYYKK